MPDDFTLFKRNGRLFYARFFDDHGRLVTTRSTGQTNEKAARKWARLKLDEELLIKSGKGLTFQEYALDWWLWDRCPYIKRRRLRKKSISPSYADTMRSYLENHILPYFGPMRLQKITSADIDDWFDSLLEKPGRKKPLSTVTVNNVLRCLKIMLAEARRRRLIAQNPAQDIEPIEGGSAKKGILTLEEVRTLFDKTAMALVWGGDRLHYTLNALACCTGMRMGELQGLRIGCIQDDYVQVFWSWSRRYGLKRPKRDSMREIPVPGKVAEHLQELIGFNPWGEETDFVFFSYRREAPVGDKGITGNFYRALNSIGISEELRRERRLSFHSHRYLFNSTLRNRVAETKLRALTGHRSEAMSDRYYVLSRHDLEDVRRITEGFFTPS